MRAADPTGSVSVEVLEPVRTDAPGERDYVWSGSLREKPWILRGVCGDLKVREFHPVRGPRAEVAERQRRVSQGLHFHLLQAHMNPLETVIFCVPLLSVITRF